MKRRVSVLTVALLVMNALGCGLVGPSCLARQHQGTVATLSGEVEAQQVAVHRVPYGTEGSQNDVDIRWSGQFDANGPRIRVYATKVECVQFVQSSLVITNGRGNPDVLGSPAEYKLWMVGDAEKTTRYSMTITWFYGPDC
jgi:hypothetical protein